MSDNMSVSPGLTIKIAVTTNTDGLVAKEYVDEQIAALVGSVEDAQAAASAAGDSAAGAAESAGTAAERAEEAANNAAGAQAAAETAVSSAQTAQEAANAAAGASAEAKETLESIPEDYKELAQEVGKLSEEIDYHVDAIKTALLLESGNVCDNAKNMPGYILFGSGNVAAHGTYFCTDFVPVRKGQMYAAYGCKGSHFAMYYPDKSYITNDTNALYDVLGIETINAWLVFTAHFDGYIRVTVDNSDTDFVLIPVNSPAWIEINSASASYPYVPETYAAKPLERACGLERVSGNISTGESLRLPSNNVKKNSVYAFSGKIEGAFGAVRIGHADTAYGASHVLIDSANLTITNYTTQPAQITQAHGLTIAESLTVRIIVKDDETADISVESNGGSYTLTGVTWYGCGYQTTGLDLYIYSECVQGALRDCVFAWHCSDIKKPVWIFGDSYVSQSNPARWTYHLAADGYLGNILLNGHPGQASYSASVAYKNLLELGKPKMAVWLLGMNQGSDPDTTTPEASWEKYVKLFVNICLANGIEPVLATIPSVPGRFHEAKNAYVRNSGYRYIDFAKAVGAQPDGTWYVGMLHMDGVHPTETGAKALYTRALIDLPEIIEGVW